MSAKYEYSDLPEGVELPEGYLVLDLETTTNAEGRLKPHDGNKIYAVGIVGCGSYINDNVVYATENDFTSITPPRVVIGHNIKYDLAYLEAFPKTVGVFRKSPSDPVPEYDTLWGYIHNRKCVVLDTQFITYLHSGHRMAFASLDETAEYWGVMATKTMDLAVELPKVGYDISKVPGILSYLRNDVSITAQIFVKILQDPWVQKNFLWLIKMHDGYMGSYEIEHNGMHVNPTRLADLRKLCEKNMKDLEVVIRDRIFIQTSDKELSEFIQLSSTDHIGALLFGGTIKIETRTAVGVYASGKKAGMPRYRISTRDVTVDPMFPGKGEKSPVSGKWMVGEHILEQCKHPLTDNILKHRQYGKLHGTYLVGLTDHIRIKEDTKQYFIYPQINMCLTATGRTSGSKPNMQNIPAGDLLGVASIYTSRYGKDGILLEVDCKQAEIYALAVLSGDPVLIDDILSGRDIHEETGKSVYGAKMTKIERRVVKTINFGLIYGAGAETLAQQSGVSIVIAKKLIFAFYHRYKGVREYFDSFKGNIQRLLDTVGEAAGYDPLGRTVKRYTWTSTTGRRYTFRDYWSDFSKQMEVSHTETRNYPIQGLATGDLVLCALGDVWRHLLTKYQDDVKLVGLVHDSLRFDLKVDVINKFVLDLKRTLENSGNSLNIACKTPDAWTLPVKVSFSKGYNFASMEEFIV